MLANKIRPQRSSPSISQKDLEAFFERQSFPLSHSKSNHKLQCWSPKSSASSSRLDKNSIQSSKNLEDEIKRLNNIILQHKQKSQTLAHENSLLTNQVRVQQILINQLKSQNQKLLDEVHYIRKSFQQIQQQRNRLLMEGGHYRNQISKMIATIEVNEQRIQFTEKSNRILIDDINFQKQMLADYKKENSMLKLQLQNFLNGIQSIKQLIIDERERFINNEKLVIDKKINFLRDQIFQFKSQINYMTTSLLQTCHQKEAIFSYVRGLKNNFQSTRTQLSLAKSFNSSFDEPDSSFLFLARENQFRQNIQNQEQKIKNLSLQVANYKKRIAQLQDELGTSKSDLKQSAPRVHTSSSYIDKIIKEHHRQIAEIRNIIDMRDQEIDRMKDQIELEQRSSISKTQQIERLQVLLRLAQNQPYQEINFQIEELKAEKNRQARLIEQMGKAQITLKSEIAEKDRILQNLIKSQKQKK